MANVSDTQSGNLDEREVTVQHAFNGAWLPNEDPALIGAENYQTLTNLRYTDKSIQGVLGYTKVNTTALETYTHLRNGHHLVTDREQASYVLVSAQNADGTASVVMENRTDIPDQGDFEGTILHTDAAGASMGRFSSAPGGNVIYCNGVETMIWAGNAMRCAGFFTVDDAAGTNPKDYTDAVNNTLEDTGNYATVDRAGQEFFLVFSTRPLQGVNFKIKTANMSSSSLTVKYWDGDSWEAVTNKTDSTSSGGITLAQDGTVGFDSTVSVAAPYHFEGLYLYAYQFEISAGSADIAQVSLDAPFQNMVDVWDGVYRQCVACQALRSSVYEDYTLEVNEESNILYPIVATLGGLTTSDEVIFMFEQPMTAIKVKMLGGYTNTTAATLTVRYWTGSAWASVSNLTDGTYANSASFNQSGLVSWKQLAIGSEFPKTLFGITGYAYKFFWSATLLDGTEHDGTSLDFVSGVPAQYTVRPFKFSSKYKNMALLCNYDAGSQGNRVDFTTPNAADVLNGDLSSDNGGQSLFFGGTEPLTCGVELYNRFGSNILATWLGIKQSETYLLNGDTPEDFKIYPISYNVGCPAPLTLCTAEMGFEMAEDVTRNVAIWLSYSGPIMFDGGVLFPIEGCGNYFNPDKAEYINTDAIENARAWYDPTYREYNLLIPSGAGQTTCNVWIVYDLMRKKWFRKDPGSNVEMPQCGFQVVDGDGVKSIYGGIDTGHLMRLEHGASWDGAKIYQEIHTGDFWPTGDVFDETIIRRFKIIAKKIEESHVLAVVHIKNTVNSGGVATFMDGNGVVFGDGSVEWEEESMISMVLSENSASRLVKADREMNGMGWAHSFRMLVETDNTARAFEPAAWAIQFRTQRTDRA